MGVFNAGDLKWLADTPTRALAAGRGRKRKPRASSGKRRSTSSVRRAKKKSASRGRSRSRRSIRNPALRAYEQNVNRLRKEGLKTAEIILRYFPSVEAYRKAVRGEADTED